MDELIRYTTPTQELVLNGADLTGCDVYVSYQQGLIGVDVEADSVEYANGKTTVTVSLTQKQSSKFRAGKVGVQVNWIYPNGKRDATTKKEIDVIGNLLDRVVAYGG